MLLKKILSRIFYIVRFIKYYYLPNYNKLGIIQGKPHDIEQKIKVRGTGLIKIGNNCFFGTKIGGRSYGETEFQVKFKGSEIILGDNICTNNNLFICCAEKIVIGNDTVIGERVTIFDFEGHGLRANQRKQIGEFGIVEIGNNVWIGNNVTILKNSIVGDNTIIAAGAVVSGQFPKNVIIGGVPAKIIKELPS